MSHISVTDAAVEADFWVITVLYNLAGWSSRIENYRAFQRNLSVPLATIEWSPFGRFDLDENDADLLIQVQEGDLMWQKERLLGIVLAALPEHVRYVAWVDCDVVFADRRWHERIRRILQEKALVQPFRRVVYLRREPTLRFVRGNESLAEVLRGGATGAGNDTIPGYGDGSRDANSSRPSFLDVYERVGDDIVRVDLDRRFEPQPRTGDYDIMARPAYGHAWAARVDALRRIGFYERCVVGGGDLLSAYALVGHFDAMIANHRSVGWDFYGGGPSYRKWAVAAADVCKGRLQCGNETIVHLYHGTLEARQYRSRIDGLAPFGLDIERDIAAEPGHPWKWTRNTSELNAYFLRYLKNRREDD